ncbi:hypothetical protein J7I80_04505 [Bacillus sp. ISL-41]|uniref:hypothetical protein n=1 Tax=Bacillus sp. ISL-41 TaxID=2819127 RepID=UPI001BE8B1D0|nr:hypothetical protein [Bacillus sp. ISL-41]MBT2641476.1 hypothetical protein [Bacillus sp. ISL-41]
MKQQKYWKGQSDEAFVVPQKPELIHNNGEALETDIQQGGDPLVAIYRFKLNGGLYESYYFGEVPEDAIKNAKKDAITKTKEIRKSDKEYIKSLKIDETNEEAAGTLSSQSIVADPTYPPTNDEPGITEPTDPGTLDGSACEPILSIDENGNEVVDNPCEESEDDYVLDDDIKYIDKTQPQYVVSEPTGGYYKSYSWDMGTGIYSSSTHFDRKATAANINGVTGSVWDIKAFNSWEEKTWAIGGSIDYMTTRYDVSYSSQKIFSYGPLDDWGGKIPVSLSGGGPSGISWSFDLGAVVTTNDRSSIANKYGRWTWSSVEPLLSPNPFVTKPGLRVGNTAGKLAIEMSHVLMMDADYGQTGVVTAYIPDR